MVLLGNTFPPDIRVEKEARVLIKAGYKIFVLCSPDKNKKEQVEYNGITIIRQGYPSKFWRTLDAIHFYFNGGTFTWKNKIKGIIRKYSINIVHIHDLSPFSYSSALAAKECGCGIVQDLHENWGDSMKEYYKVYPLSLKTFFFRYIFPIKLFFNRLENKMASIVDLVITTVEEMKERIIQNEVNPSKIIVVKNTENSKYFTSLQIDECIYQKYKNIPIGIFVGVLDRLRGIENLIESMPLILNHYNLFKLVIVGNGSIKQILFDRSKELNLEKSVE